MVYIIGIGHTIQHDKVFFFDETKGFVDEIKILAKDFSFKLIAEEYSVEAASKDQVLSSNTKDVADELGILHRYCDPDSKERKTLGWFSKEDDLLRIENWFGKIVDMINESIFFVCGNDHKYDFAKLIKEKGFEATVIKKTFITSRDLLY